MVFEPKPRLWPNRPADPAAFLAPDAGDLIDVSDIAAFGFIGTGPFSGTGGAELRVEQSGANTLVAGDFNGDAAADFEIQVNATTASAFTAEDFLLA